MTYCYPYRRGTGWRSPAFRSNRNQGANGAGGHTGFDHAMDPGTPLYAPADGIVRNSSWVSENYLDNPWWLTQMGGDILVLDCFGPDGTTNTGPTFVLAHLSDSIADVGQRVRKGELIALSGNTGTATTGPHCHIEALPPNWDFNNGVYGRVDPEAYFDEWPDNYISTQGLAAMGGTVNPLPKEEELVPNATDKVFKSKDGSTVSLQDILNSMDTKIDGVPELIKLVKAQDIDFRGEFDKVRARDEATSAALVTMVDLLAKQQNLTVADVQKALEDGIAKGITLTVKAGS